MTASSWIRLFRQSSSARVGNGRRCQTITLDALLYPSKQQNHLLSMVRSDGSYRLMTLNFSTFVSAKSRPGSLQYWERKLQSRIILPAADTMIRSMNCTPSLRNLNANVELRSQSLHPWHISRPKEGTGFDNFIPKDKDEDKEPKNTSSSGEGGESNNNSKRNKKNNNSNGDLFYLSLLLGAILLLKVYFDQQPGISRQQQDALDSKHQNEPAIGWNIELSWHDFLQLLQKHQIAKIIIMENRSAAFVIARSPGASGSTLYSVDHSQEQTKNDKKNVDNQIDGLGDDKIEFGGSSSNTFNDSLSSSSQSKYTYILKIGSSDSFERKLEEAQRSLFGTDTSYDVPVQYISNDNSARDFLSILPGLVLAFVMYRLLKTVSNGVGGMPGSGGSTGGRGGGIGGIFQIGKSTAKRINKEDVKVTFDDVAGCEEAKKEIMEFVDFLKDSDRFTKLGAKIPKGALLCGPPGTGKTLLAKAVAGEAGVPFYSISGSDFIEMFVGVGPSRVRDLFSEARQNAPCIVFIDEIDAVGRQRGRGGFGGNDERENTLNQLLVEMDGFSPSTGVVVLAGTNRADVLDNALTRAGRFDRQIVVDKPDLKGRQAIFKVHLKGLTLADKIEDIAGRLAGLTPGFSGADIANICNEAAIVAARRKGETVSLEDFEKATDRIIGGLESNKIMSKEELNIVAHHEAGHAVAGWYLEHTDPLLKVTIIPRSSGALGFAQYLPKEVFLRTQDQIMDIVCMALAGRAAEEIFFGRVTTGASDDLKRVTRLVYSTIQLYGMNSRLGQLSFPKNPNAMYEERPYSEKTAKAMDEEAKLIVDQAYQRTLNLLREKKKELQTIATMLLEKETITHMDIEQAIGKRPFQGDLMYDEFIRKKQTSTDEQNKTDNCEPGSMEGVLPNEQNLNPGVL